VGILTYIMMSGTPPFYDEDKNRLNRKIVKSKLSFGPMFNKVSDEGKSFIENCLIKKQADRPQIAEMLQHPWITNIKEVDVSEEVQLDVAANLSSFKKVDVFQSGVMSLIAGLMSTSKELQELDQMFKKFDSDNDGTLSRAELEAGMRGVIGEFAADLTDWTEFFDAIDSNHDGEVDY